MDNEPLSLEDWVMDAHDLAPSYCFIEPANTIGMVGNLPIYTNPRKIYK